MTASSISSLFANNALSSLYGTSAGVSPYTPPAATTSGSAVGNAASANVSPATQLLGNLQQLQTSDPQQFQSLLTSFAGSLQSAGTQLGGTQGQALFSLASKVQNAAQTGNISQIIPAEQAAIQAGPVNGNVLNAISAYAANGASTGAQSTVSGLFSELSQQVMQDLSQSSSVGASNTASALSF